MFSIILDLMYRKFSLVLIGILLSYSLLFSQYFDYIPLWDAWSDTATLIEAVSKPFNLFNFEMSGHPSQAYFLLLGTLQYFDLGNPVLIHLIDLLLGLGMICAFYGILRIILTDKKNLVEVYLATLLFSFYPILLANALNVTYDFGVVVFMIGMIYFLLRKNYLLSFLCGIGEVFSKEPGIVIYFATIVLYFLIVVPDKRKIFRLADFKKILLMILPLLLIGLYIIAKPIFLGRGAFFQNHFGIFTSSTPYTIMWPTWDNSKIRAAYGVAIFIINFNWILTIIISVSIIRLIHSLISKRKLTISGVKINEGIFIFCLFLVVIFIISYIKIFMNLRYFLTVYPFLILLSFIFIVQIPNKFIRRTILAVIFIIFFFSNFYTFDPVSKKIYGTFQFGKHEMLKMTSLTGECCGFGRDQLVYNLQFVYIDRLTNQILKDIKVDENMAIAYDRLIGNILDLPVDRQTFKRTPKTINSFIPWTISWSFISRFDAPDQVYWIEYPNVTQDDFMYYLPHYNIIAEKIYEQDGYAIKVYTLERKVKEGIKRYQV